MLAHPHRSTLPPRWSLAALALSLVACQSDRVVDTSDDDDRVLVATAGGPTVEILYPAAGSSCKWAGIACNEVQYVWQGDDGSGSHSEIVGFQFKLIDAGSPNPCPIPFDWVLDWLRGPGCRVNLLIPPSSIVDDAVPVTDSTFHECDWYPKAASPFPDTTAVFAASGLATGALAIRAVDVDGNVTPVEAFAQASDGEPGNVLIVKAAENSWDLVVHERTLGFHTGSPHRDVDVPAGYDLEFDWLSRRTPCGPVPAFEYAFAIDISDPDCDECTDPDGMGGWSPWSADATALPFQLTLTEEDVGRTRSLHVRVRDLGFEQNAPPPVGIYLQAYAGSFERPALWVDDFASDGIDDCEHDALVGPWLDDAVRPYIRAQEGIARWAAHPPGDDPCMELGELSIPSLDELLRFRMLFWNVLGTNSGTALGGGSDILSDYVRAGGGVVVWGRHTIGALLGDTYVQDGPYEPELPQFPSPDFGPGSFVWDIAHLRTTFDAVGRGTSRHLSPACSGIVGLEATETAIAEGYPVGALDPSGYSTDPANTTVSPRTAIWFDRWKGRQNLFGAGGDVASGPPPLHVEGLDTLYVCATNSWSYLEDGTSAIRDVCGNAFLSSFEGKPVVMRYDDPVHGRVVWIGVELTDFAANHSADIERILAKLIEWILEQE